MNKFSQWHRLFLFKYNGSYYVYGGIILFFIIWMLLLDTHSWSIHAELNSEIRKLKRQREALVKIIEEDRKTISLLKNKDSLERFAREEYGHKKDDETLFIIEFKDSPSRY